MTGNRWQKLGYRTNCIALSFVCSVGCKSSKRQFLVQDFISAPVSMGENESTTPIRMEIYPGVEVSYVFLYLPPQEGAIMWYKTNTLGRYISIRIGVIDSTSSLKWV